MSPPLSSPTRAARSSGPRRHRTVQRERMLEILRSTDTHPTAADLFEALRSEFPRCSLATVYRNLDVLVDEGAIDQVRSRKGIMRYDANPVPHHHFVCEACGEIRDLDIRLPRALTQKLEHQYRLPAQQVRADFFGLCPECSDRES